MKDYARARALNNIVCLPYLPIEKLAASLSAADLHLVVMGEPFVGIVHPCKIYNILAANRRFLYIGPSESSITDLMSQLSSNSMGQVSHGDVEGTVERIERAMKAEIPGTSFASDIASVCSQEVLVQRMTAAVMQEVPGQRGELQPVVGPADKVA